MWHGTNRAAATDSSAPTRNRTWNLPIKSRLLCQLSYRRSMNCSHQQGDGVVCAICKKPCRTGRSLAKDHDHKTGKVRGRLCLHCNVGLGHFQDSPALLLRAVDYLHRDRKPHTKRWAGQIIDRGNGRWLLRLYRGRLRGKRTYRSKTVYGTRQDAAHILEAWHTAGPL